MRPKLAACLDAIHGGVSLAHIVDGRVPHSLLLELFTDAGIGTKVPAAGARDRRARSPQLRALPRRVRARRGRAAVGRRGHEYLDFLAGIAVCNVGHCHPAVVAAVAGAGGAPDARLQPLLHRADGAAGRAAGGALARRQGVLLQLRRRGQRGGDQARAQAPAAAGASSSLHGGFHGRTYGALSATPQETKQAPFAPLVPGFVAVLRRRPRRSPARSTATPRRVVLEPIQGETGVHPLLRRAAGGRARGLRRARRAADPRRGPDRDGAHRHAVGLRAATACARRDDGRQGPGRRAADRRADRPRRDCADVSRPATTARRSPATRSSRGRQRRARRHRRPGASSSGARARRRCWPRGCASCRGCRGSAGAG